MNPCTAFVRSVQADYAAIQQSQQRYHGRGLPDWRLPIEAVRRIGFQMMIVVRVMRLVRDMRIPLAAQVVSRTIRYVYGAEIHWDAEIADGVSIVHGTGLVLSHCSVIGPGCILFQGVTLGESIDPVSREVGAPHLGRNVHVGPGAVLLGPISVGDGTKLMANVVLDRSVPAESVVRAPVPQVVARGGEAVQ